MIVLMVAALQVSAILLVALGLAWVLRKRTAALRHLVLAIAMGCSALVPIVGALPAGPVAGTIVLPLLEGPSAITRPGGSAPTSAAMPGNGRTLAPQGQSTPIVAAAPGPHRSWHPGLPRILEAAWTIYLAGLFVSIATLLFGLLQLRWFAARSSPLDSKRWLRQAAVIANSYQLKRPICITLNAHKAVLATWGIWRPRILLPGDASDWTEDRIRAVLLHELAHVQRNDWMIQLLATVLRSVYWFNPLVWIACTRLQQESESACDDAAISRGASRTGYATHLLELARAMARPAAMLAPAPSMARRSTLRRRIANILDPATRRTPATGRSVIAVATTMLLVTFVVGGCQITTTRQYAVTREQPSTPQRLIPESAPAVASSFAVPPAEREAEAIVTSPAPIARKPPPSSPAIRDHDSAPSPKALAAAIVEYAEAMLSGGMSDEVTGYPHLMGTMGSVQRTAQRVLDDEGHASGVSAKGTALLSALADTANSAARIASRPSTSGLARQELAQIEAALRAKQAEFSALLLPLPPVTAILVSTPERRAAVRALDLAQTARAESAFIQPGPRVSLLAALETLERAAQSVLMGDDSDRSIADGKLTALSTAILLTDRVATNIGSRANERNTTRDKARELAQSLRALTPQLGFMSPSEAEQSQNEARWLGWMMPGLQPRE